MASRPTRWLRRSLLLLALLAGCSSASERILGWYVTRTLDGYFDFESEQKREVRKVVDETLAWLRQTELPHWITFLREVRQGIHDGLDDARMARLQQRYDERLDTAVELLTPRVAPLLAKLSARQLDRFAKRVRSDLEEQYDELPLPPQKRSAKIEKRGLEAIEDFVGSLEDDQRAKVRALIRALPDERPLQFQAATANLARFRAFMAQRPPPAAIEAELQRMWAQRYDRLGPGHDKPTRRAVQRDWLLAVYRLLHAEQRAHAEELLSDRIRMLKGWVLPPQPT